MRIGVGLAVLALGAQMAGACAQSAPYEDAIYAACSNYGCDGAWLYNTMLCESGGDPSAYNVETGDTGLLQFHPATFYENGGTDINDPYQQIDIAAKMFSEGLAYEWLCA